MAHVKKLVVFMALGAAVFAFVSPTMQEASAGVPGFIEVGKTYAAQFPGKVLLKITVKAVDPSGWLHVDFVGWVTSTGWVNIDQIQSIRPVTEATVE